MEILNEGYGIMPNVVLYSKELTDKQKLLYCLISSLCAEKGYCRASNKFLGEKLNVKERTISNGIKKLCELGFINSDVDKNKGNERHITIGIVKNHMTYCEKSQEGYCEKSQYNNTIYNSTIEYIYANYYGKSRGIDEKVCNKIINTKLEQGITLEDIKKSMVLYNCDCRIKQDYTFVKKFETWIKEFQKPTDEQLEEQLSIIVKTYRDKRNSDEKFSKSAPATTIWNDLKETFGEEKVNQLWKQSSSTINLKFN